MSNKRICIITTVHPIFDVRIFHREAKTLSEYGYSVYLIGPHHKEDFIDNIRIIPISTNKKHGFCRLIRDFDAFFKMLRIPADVYHLHDPELIPIAVILRLFNKKVIYDVHEVLAKQIYSKTYIPPLFRKLVSVIARFIEKIAVLSLDRIIVAGEDIQEQPHFRKFKNKITLIRNFPVITLDREEALSKPKDKVTFIYSGGLTEDRGILEIVRAFKSLKLNNIELIILGRFNSLDFEKEVRKEIRDDSRIRLIPFLPYKEMFDILVKTHIGLIIFHPTPNNIGALSGRNNKIYEYMQAGLAIIGSNFPYWKDFIEGNRIGVTVDPKNVSDIKSAMEFLTLNPEILEEMEYNSKRLSENYSWEAESKKLIDLYNELIDEKN